MTAAISVTICGDGGCGKSSLTLRIVHGAWTSDYDPTIEDSYTVTRTVDGQTFPLHITDTAGQEEYRPMFSAGNLGSDAFLLVYSITSRQSFDVLSLWEKMIEEETTRRGQDNDTTDNGGSGSSKCWPGVMVVGNKCDLSAQREVSSREGLQWARERGYGFMETSARDSVNVEETFGALVKRVIEARRAHAAGEPQPSPPMMRSPVLSATDTSAAKQARKSDSANFMSEKQHQQNGPAPPAAEQRKSEPGQRRSGQQQQRQQGSAAGQGAASSGGKVAALFGRLKCW